MMHSYCLSDILSSIKKAAEYFFPKPVSVINTISDMHLGSKFKQEYPEVKFTGSCSISSVSPVFTANTHEKEEDQFEDFITEGEMEID